MQNTMLINNGLGHAVGGDSQHLLHNPYGCNYFSVMEGQPRMQNENINNCNCSEISGTIKEKQEDNQMSFAIIMGNENGIVACTDGRSTRSDGTVLSDEFRKVWKFDDKNLIVTATGVNRFYYSEKLFDTKIVHSYEVEEAVQDAVAKWNGTDLYDLAQKMHDRFAAPVYKMSQYQKVPVNLCLQYGFFEDGDTFLARSQFYYNTEEFKIARTFETKALTSGKFAGILSEIILPEYDTPLKELEDLCEVLVKQMITLDSKASKNPVIGGQIFKESMLSNKGIRK